MSFIPGEEISTSLTRLADGNSETIKQIRKQIEILALTRPELAEIVRNTSVDLSISGSSRFGPSDFSTLKLLNFISRAHGRKFSLIRRLDGGFSVGAHLVRGESKSESNYLAVLKWTTNKFQSSLFA